MLSVANKPTMLRIVILNVVMLSVMAPSLDRDLDATIWLDGAGKPPIKFNNELSEVMIQCIWNLQN
jgi:hypothetical protein